MGNQAYLIQEQQREDHEGEHGANRQSNADQHVPNQDLYVWSPIRMGVPTHFHPQQSSDHNVLFQSGTDESFGCDKRYSLRECKYHDLPSLMPYKGEDFLLVQSFALDKSAA